jgi:hypothetical protein
MHERYNSFGLEISFIQHAWNWSHEKFRHMDEMDTNFVTIHIPLNWKEEVG